MFLTSVLTGFRPGIDQNANAEEQESESGSKPFALIAASRRPCWRDMSQVNSRRISL